MLLSKIKKERISVIKFLFDCNQRLNLSSKNAGGRNGKEEDEIKWLKDLIEPSVEEQNSFQQTRIATEQLNKRKFNYNNNNNYYKNNNNNHHQQERYQFARKQINYSRSQAPVSSPPLSNMNYYEKINFLKRICYELEESGKPAPKKLNAKNMYVLTNCETIESLHNELM